MEFENRKNFEAIDRLRAYIDQNKTADWKEVMRVAEDLAKPLGISANSLITRAHGLMIKDELGLNYSKPMIKLADEIMENDPTPGERFILDPSNPKTPIGEDIAKQWLSEEPKNGKVMGEAFVRRLKHPIFDKDDEITKILVPRGMVIRDAKTDLEKMFQSSVLGHEGRHLTDSVNDPRMMNKFLDMLESEQPQAGKLGHHSDRYLSKAPIYELDQLIKQVRGFPPDTDLIDSIESTAKVNKAIKNLEKTEQIDPETSYDLRSKLKPSRNFGKLMAVLGPVGALLSAGADASERKYGGAALKALSAFDPTGLSDAAVDINERLNMSPEELKQQLREDKYKAMPIGLDSPADIMLDQLEDEVDIQKEREKQKRKLGYK